MINRRRILMLDSLKEYTIIGNPASFNTNVSKPLRQMLIPFAPVQEGSGDPSPTNVRPITGWTGLTAYRTGINIWDEEWEVGSIGTSGEPIPGNNNTIRSKNYIPCKPGTSYCIPMYSYQSGAYVYGIYQYDVNKNYIGFASINATTKVFTTAVKAYYLKFRTYVAYGTIYNHDISINYPSTDTDYHQYSGTSIPVVFPAEAGTVYGGALDLTTGELTVNRSEVDLGTLNWSITGDRFSVAQMLDPNPIIRSVWGVDAPIAICSHYKYGNISNGNGVDKAVGFYNGILFARDTSYSTAEDFKTAVSGVQLVYELSEPLTYQLTPEEITTLIDDNTIWSNTNGQNTIKYLKKG